MFIFLPFMRDPGTVIVFRREDGDAPLRIATANRGANGAGASWKRGVRPGDWNENQVIIGFDGNRMGSSRAGCGDWKRLVLSLSGGVNYAKQLIGAKRR